MLDALCLLCDCLEFGNDALFNAIAGQAAPKLIQVIEELGQQRHDYVQTCIFALGCLAMRTPSGELASLQKVMNIALNIQQNAHLFKREKGEPHACVDNSLSCLAKLCYS